MTRLAIGYEPAILSGNGDTHHNATFRRLDVAMKIEERDSFNKRHFPESVKSFHRLFRFFFSDALP
jgi:hypothetical protein